MSRREELLRVWREHADIGYIPCFFMDYNFLRPQSLNERPDGHDGYDWFGVHWTYEPKSKAPMVTLGRKPVITDICQWKEQVTMPDLSQVDWEKWGAEETAGWDRENKVSVLNLINGTFERSHHLMGFENALMAMLEEPEAYTDLLNAIADYKCEIIRKMAKYYKPDIVMMHDDYGAANSMLMGPEVWRRLIKDPLSRLVQTAHENGLVYEHHSCGYIEPIIGDLIEIGVDSLNPLQPCNNLAEIKKRYGGKLTLCGGFDSQGVLDRPGVTDEEIMADVQRAYDTLAPGGGYVSMIIAIGYDRFGPAFCQKHKEIAYNY